MSVARLQAALIERGYGERVRADEPLAPYTTYRIGGPADLLLTVRQQEELLEVLDLAEACQVPTLILGGGSNILVADAGVRGFVVINGCRAYRCEESDVIAESGVMLRKLAAWTVSQGLEGLHWAVGVPGTLGGAVVGNAGAYGGAIADNLAWARLRRPDGTVERVDAAQLDYGYRISALKREPRDGPRSVVLEASFRLEPGQRDVLDAVVASITERRLTNTPQGCCAGSIFKRTLQYPAGYLIDQAGLKGLRVGGAEVSPKHANFLMNVADASARDVKQLIEVVQRRVWERFAQRLEPEIEFIGAWDDAPAPPGSVAEA